MDSRALDSQSSQCKGRTEQSEGAAGGAQNVRDTQGRGPCRLRCNASCHIRKSYSCGDIWVIMAHPITRLLESARE